MIYENKKYLGKYFIKKTSNYHKKKFLLTKWLSILDFTHNMFDIMDSIHILSIFVFIPGMLYLSTAISYVSSCG